MKKSVFVLLLLCLFLIPSCDYRMEGFEDPASIPDNVIIARIGQETVLSCEFINPVWYSCSDPEGHNPELLVNSSTLTVPAFIEPGLKYFLCEGSDGNRKIYVVGCTGLKQIEIDSKGQVIDSKITYRDSTVTIFEKDGSVLEKNIPVQIRGRGNSTWFKSLKKGYKLKFDEKRKVFGLSKSKTWPLIPNAFDNTMLGNWFAGYIRNEIFDVGWNPSYVFCDLVINGVYLGPYVIAEGIKIGSSRIDIQSLDDLKEDVNNDGVIDINDGGFLLEISMKRDGQMPFNTSHGVCAALVDPSGEDIKDISMRDVEYYIKGKLNRLEDAVYGISDESVSELLDIESFVDWYIVNEFLDNSDASLHMSTYMYYNPSDGKLHMGPCWDFDHYVSRNPGALSVDVPRSIWIHELLKDSQIKDLVRERWNTKKEDLKTAINQTFLQMGTTLTTAGYMDSYRWNKDINYPETVQKKYNEIKARFVFFDSYLNHD